jgi:hypothetical protein
MKTRWADKTSRMLGTFFAEPMTKYVVIFTTTISIIIVAQVFFDSNEKDGYFLSLADKQFTKNFVEWFGILLGIVLATVLDKVWDQFSAINNAINIEANATKSLVDELMLLDAEYDDVKIQTLYSLSMYSKYVLYLINGKIPISRESEAGTQILDEIRAHLIKNLLGDTKLRQGSDILKNELLTQLNNIFAARSNRISLLSVRIFDNLSFLSILASFIWLIPFYFLYFPDPQTGEDLQLGIFGWLLIVSVTFFIITLLSLIEDLGNPFNGVCRVDKLVWEKIVATTKEDNKEHLGNGIVSTPKMTL